MSNKNLLALYLIGLGTIFSSQTGVASESVTYPFYLGGIGGYGASTWNGLVPSQANKNIAMSMSTPIDVYEGGAVFGVLAGYEFSPYFSIEVNYLKYPDAQIWFDTSSLFSFDHNKALFFNSETETVSLSGKVMLKIPRTKLKAYSSAGVADLHRKDMLLDQWLVTPTFGVGLIYAITERWAGEVAANYTAGFGESQLHPVNGYFPFLYSVTARLAYHF